MRHLGRNRIMLCLRGTASVALPMWGPTIAPAVLTGGDGTETLLLAQDPVATRPDQIPSPWTWDVVHTRRFVALLVGDCTRNNIFLLLGNFKWVGALPWGNGNVHRRQNATHYNSWELSLNQHILRFCKSLNLLLQKKKSNLSRLFDCKWVYWKCAFFSEKSKPAWLKLIFTQSADAAHTLDIFKFFLLF